ncbi:DUF3291 domain-containing protein [Nocardia sp. alder85J]|uniref:DUF3291 domain-containing protein n=1 Tax=Nocardia sp. alder85J TaxID=2862949 RepID=UPI001CD70866|nr:DUF3291 domain-containing protein [Nocardia sp. alder85J]MCX4094872.1 DUF3291 domain-containing protein [Nocardia sp. alder85J]
MNDHHLAQVNIALPLEPLTSARLAGFVGALDEINALADAAPGFVWRLQTEDGDATAIRAFGDDRIIVNMTVWTSPETLAEFVYRSGHAPVMRRRRDWFAPFAEAYQALWWIPAGTVPTVADAEERITHLRTHGPTAHAFTFRTPFPAPNQPAPAPRLPEDLSCPA